MTSELKSTDGREESQLELTHESTTDPVQGLVADKMRVAVAAYETFVASSATAASSTGICERTVLRGSSSKG